MKFELTEKEYTDAMIDEIYKRSKNIGYNVELKTYDMFLKDTLESGVFEGDDITTFYCAYLEKCFNFIDALTKQEDNMKKDLICFDRL